MTNRKALRLPADIRPSGWYRLLPEPPPPRILEEERRADWVILGAGFAGLSAARRLSQLVPGERIVVLDAQRIGWGAAGRNSGFMIDLPHELSSESYAGGLEHDRKQIRMNRVGIAFATEAAEEYGLKTHFAPVGKYHGAATPHGLQALAVFEKHLANLKEPFEHLDAEGMRRLTGEVRTPRLILANNGHAENFGYFVRRLMHIFTFATMTRKLTAAEAKALGGEKSWGMIPADPMGTTVRRIADDRIVIRNTFTYNPDMRTSERQIEAIGRDHDRSFAARFPMLKGVTPEYRWGGHLCLSLNAVPAFGEVEKQVYAACCCNGLGTVKGTLYGKLVADLAVGCDEPMVNDALAEPALEQLYPEPLMTWGAKTKLWWVQKRAGREL